jgi:GNAT superfamily N-acetyltransferase
LAGRTLLQVTEIVTYVEMTDRGQLSPGTPVPGLALVAADDRLPVVSDVMARVGAPYGWRSAHRSPQQWQDWFAEHPGRSCWLLTVHGDPAGVACYDPHPGPEVEIKTFGLVPDYTGQGLGGHALTLAIGQAWELVPGTRRVWLHTSSVDNPHALPNYHRRGLRTFKTEEHPG